MTPSRKDMSPGGDYPPSPAPSQHQLLTKQYHPSYVHSLEERVAFLEVKLQSHGIDLESGTEEVQTSLLPLNANSDILSASSRSPARESPTHPEESVIQPLLEARAHGPTRTLSQMLRFGTQTDVSFHRLLFAELYKIESSLDLAQAWEEPYTSVPNDYVQFEVPKNLEPSPVSLPEQQVSERLTRVYFEFSNFSSPALHEPTFRQKLELAHAIQDPNHVKDGDSQSRLAVFFSYMVFAVALLTLQKHDATGVPTSLCERYYSAALHCLDTIGLPADLEGVQVLLLIAQYSYLHPSVFCTWKTVGMAMRLAVELGLHNDPPPGKLDPLTLDTRRRVFWVAYSMDRTVGTIMGRPFCLSDGAIDTQFPSPVNDDLITSEGIVHGECPPLGKKAFSLHYFRYRQLQSEIQVTLRERKPAGYPQINLDLWQQDMHRRLEAWKSSKPQDSAPSNIAPPDVLELAYHQAIISLYRPSPMIPSPTESTMMLLAASASFFIRLYRRLHRENKLRLFWQAVYNLFAAGAALIYCYSHSVQVRERISFRAVENSVHSCSAALWAMVERFPAARGKRDAFDAIASAALDSIVSAFNISAGGVAQSDAGSSVSGGGGYGLQNSPTFIPSVAAVPPRLSENENIRIADMTGQPDIHMSNMAGDSDFMSWTQTSGEDITSIDDLSLNLGLFQGAGSFSLSTWF